MTKLILTVFLVAAVTGLHAQEVETDSAGFPVFEYVDGDTTFTMKRYFFCFLKTGANRSHPASEVAKIQEGHLAHLSKLARDRKICMSGPFGDHDEYQGIVVYNVTTEKEALELANADPAVQAGRLSVEIVAWWGAKGTSLF